MLVEDAAAMNGDPLAVTERCINSFVAGVKHNKSIVVAKIELTGLSINDLSYFILNNKALKTLVLASRERVTLMQSAILSEAISSAQLEEVNIRHCRFRNDEAFERILGACSSSSVKILDVPGKHDWQCTEVAALLRGPAKNVIRELRMGFLHFRNALDQKEDMTTNIALNNYLCFAGKRASHQILDLEKLLCNSSSLESISNSNHTLECVTLVREGLSPYLLGKRAEKYLEFNRNPDKTKVIHDKIRWFYFVGQFDVSLFLDLPASILPEVMSKIKGKDKLKLSAVYRLLQSIPYLCNVSQRLSSEQNGNERLKISLAPHSSS